MLHIEATEIIVMHLPLKFHFETSFSVQTKKVIPLLILKSSDLEGPPEETMEFNHEETFASTLHMLHEVFLPRVAS